MYPMTDYERELLLKIARITFILITNGERLISNEDISELESLILSVEYELEGK
jgi:hypothetical protein